MRALGQDRQCVARGSALILQEMAVHRIEPGADELLLLVVETQCQDGGEWRTQDVALVLRDDPEPPKTANALRSLDLHRRLARLKGRLGLILPLSRQLLEPLVLFLGRWRRLPCREQGAREQHGKSGDNDLLHDALLG